ncbi:MAG: hypothetical protein AB7S44_01820 [Spirochaetales bacterium]
MGKKDRDLIIGNNIIITEKGNDRVKVDNSSYHIVENGRGKRSKFWLSKQNGDKLENLYLFKQNLISVSREDIGELFYYLLSKQVKAPAVECHLAKYQRKDGSIECGILSKNYKTKDSIVEISGKSILLQYADKYFDNNNGKKVQLSNCVNSYMDAIKYLYADSKIDYKDLRDSLVQQVILDYLYHQNDRHWGNITFLMDEEIGPSSIRVADSYDNGNMFLLNKDIFKINQYLTQINGGDKLFTDAFFAETKKNVPLFAISIPTVNKMYGNESESKSYDCLEPCQKEIPFAIDIAKELLKNPEMKMFYENVKNNTDIMEAVAEMSQTEEMPKGLEELSQLIFENRTAKIDEAMLNLVARKEAKEQAKLSENAFTHFNEVNSDLGREIR